MQNKAKETPISASPFTPPVFAGSYYSGVDYDYDYYGRSEWAADEDDYAYYEGLRLTSVDAYSAVNGLLLAGDKPLPDEIVQMIEKNDWNNINNWDIEAENDYYGQTVKIIPPSDMEEKLSAWYWNLPNADDSAGVLRYVRAKGVETQGLTPIEAIKIQLAEENKGMSHPLLENVNSAYRLSLRVREIVVPNKEWLDKVEPRPIENKGDSYPVAGVVVFHRNQYVLIDGYHRFKDLQNKQAKDKYSLMSDFIVLHHARQN